MPRRARSACWTPATHSSCDPGHPSACGPGHAVEYAKNRPGAMGFIACRAVDSEGIDERRRSSRRRPGRDDGGAIPMAARDADAERVATLIAVQEGRFPIPLLDDAAIAAL